MPTTWLWHSESPVVMARSGGRGDWENRPAMAAPTLDE